MNCGTLLGWNNHRTANTPACSFCKAAKAKHDAGIVVVAPVRSKQQVAQCGSVSGYNKHRKAGEPACPPCREAANEASRIRKAKKRGERASARPAAQCGTVSGYARHRRLDEEPCAPCRESKRIQSQRNRDKAPKSPSRELIPCPSNAAYLRHLRDGEEACAPCKEGERLRAIEKRANKVAREGGPRPHAGRKPINHGTTAGRAQHKRRGETPCPPCKAAFNEYNRAYSASARKKAKAQQ